jgi:hypothetical protein
MEIADKEEIGDHPPGKHHGKDDKPHKKAPAPEPFFRKGVGAQNGRKHTESRTYHGEQNGVPHGVEDLSVQKELLIRFQIEFYGPQKYFPGTDRPAGTE